MCFQHYIRVISLVEKGRDYSEEDQRNSDRGRIPKESSDRGRSPKESSNRGSIPKGRMTLCH
jgi:hypothetical protein